MKNLGLWSPGLRNFFWKKFKQNKKCKQNIFRHLWKHSRLLNKYPPWIVRTLHCRSLFKTLKSYTVVVEFHFLARMKALALKYSKAWFPWSRLSWKDLKESIQKVRLLGRGKEFMTKVTKSHKGWRECSQKLMSLSPIFSMPIFSSTQFFILGISCGSDNVKVTSIKTHPRGFLCGILSTWLVSACVSMCKSECENSWKFFFCLLFLSSHI